MQLTESLTIQVTQCCGSLAAAVHCEQQVAVGVEDIPRIGAELAGFCGVHGSSLACDVSKDEPNAAAAEEANKYYFKWTHDLLLLCATIIAHHLVLCLTLQLVTLRQLGCYR